MSLLTPDFGLLFWMLISFGIVFFILAKKGFPVITRMVDKRRDYIQKSLEAADEANRKLEHIREESDKIVSQAQQKQAEMIRTAIAESEKIIQNAHAKAAIETDKQLEAARKRIEAQKNRAMADINSQVAILSVEIAEKVLRHELDDKANQQKLIMEMIDEAEDIRRKRTGVKSDS